MGRPIKPKYIGKYNPGQDAGATLLTLQSQQVVQTFLQVIQ